MCFIYEKTLLNYVVDWKKYNFRSIQIHPAYLNLADKQWTKNSTKRANTTEQQH